MVSSFFIFVYCYVLFLKLKINKLFFISFKYFYFSGVSQSFIPRERGAESKCEPGDFSKLVKPAAVYTPGHGARTILGHVCSSSADTYVPLFPGVNPKLQLDKLS